MVTCCVCSKEHSPLLPRQFHSFPRDAERRKKWFNSIGHIIDTYKNQKVCSDHFIEGDYYYCDILSKRRRLKKTAIPSVFIQRSCKNVKKDSKSNIQNDNQDGSTINIKHESTMDIQHQLKTQVKEESTMDIQQSMNIKEEFTIDIQDENIIYSTIDIQYEDILSESLLKKDEFTMNNQHQLKTHVEEESTMDIQQSTMNIKQESTIDISDDNIIHSTIDIQYEDTILPESSLIKKDDTSQKSIVLTIEIPEEHFRHILLYYFYKGKSAEEAHKKLHALYGKATLKERQCQDWFARFLYGDFNMKNTSCSGRPTVVNEDKIKALVEANHHSTIREIAKALNMLHTNVAIHLKKLGFVQKLNTWVPHELNETHLTQRIDICDSLLKREKNNPFLKRMITGDEKWIVYNNNNNVQGKRSWSRQDKTAQSMLKAEIHETKVLLSVWWDWKGVVFFELFPMNQTIDSNVYCRQLDKLDAAIRKKRPELVKKNGVVFHHDNARLHTSLMIRQKLLELGWDVLPHPPYSPDITPSDYHLFRFLQNSLNGVKFNSNEDVKNYLVQFFANRDKTFYECGIMKLVERWQKVLQQDGQYINE